MFFRRRVPRPPLDRHVDIIWDCVNDPQPFGLERILPTGAAQLIVNLKEDRTRGYEGDGRCQENAGTILAGVRAQYGIIDTREQERVVGVCFKPGGTVPFMRAPAHLTSGSDVPLADLWDPATASRLRERLLEAPGSEARLDVLEDALADAWRPVEVHPCVAYALQVFHRQPLAARVTAVTEATGLSAKRFIERFKADVGLTPKRFCRVLRFQRAVAVAHAGRDVDWTRLALDCGYFDQSHFVHDFRAFSGLSPTAYQEARTASPNHVKFLQDADASR